MCLHPKSSLNLNQFKPEKHRSGCTNVFRHIVCWFKTILSLCSLKLYFLNKQKTEDKLCICSLEGCCCVLGYLRFSVCTWHVQGKHSWLDNKEIQWTVCFLFFLHPVFSKRENSTGAVTIKGRVHSTAQSRWSVPHCVPAVTSWRSQYRMWTIEVTTIHCMQSACLYRTQHS